MVDKNKKAVEVTEVVKNTKVATDSKVTADKKVVADKEEGVKKKVVGNKKMLMTLGLVLGVLLVIVILGSSVIPRVLVSVSKSAPGVRVSFSDSYVLAEKILARADGVDECVVNVFLMDEDGRGVPGKSVRLEGMNGIEPEMGMTDSMGKVSFTMRSTEEGQFDLKGSVEGIELPQGVTVTFRD